MVASIITTAHFFRVSVAPAIAASSMAVDIDLEEIGLGKLAVLEELVERGLRHLAVGAPLHGLRRDVAVR